MDRRIITAITACAAAVTMLLTPSANAAAPMDYVPDGKINCFDVIAARRKGVPTGELKALTDHILGRGKFDGDYTLDKELVLEPKGGCVNLIDELGDVSTAGADAGSQGRLQV